VTKKLVKNFYWSNYILYWGSVTFVVVLRRRDKPNVVTNMYGRRFLSWNSDYSCYKYYTFSFI